MCLQHIGHVLPPPEPVLPALNSEVLIPKTFVQDMPDGFVEQFERLGAVAFLADGCGLNFVCVSSDLVRCIEKLESEIAGAPREQ